MIGFASLENTLSWGMAMRSNSSQGGALAAKRTMRALTHGVDCIKSTGDSDVPVTCLITDSRRVAPGALFFAIEGANTSGSFYVEEAIDRGAVGIVGEREPGPRMSVPYYQVKDARVALAEIAGRFFDHPDRAMDLVGITGTNGKTTVSMLTQHLLAEKPSSVGLLGTVRYDLGRRTLPSYKTTPESVDIYSMLDQMRIEGCESAVLEVSSHAIDQHRVRGMRFPVAAFLNLTQDHIDYHMSMDEYFQVKRRLFTGETGNQPEVCVINIDDPYGLRLAKELEAKGRVITFGTHEAAEIRAEQIQLSPNGSVFKLTWQGGEAEVATELAGKYNVSNLLAALAICAGMGKDLQQVLPRVASFPGVPGRMERIDVGQTYPVLVDYAHTDDALRNALSMLREITPGRVLVVFGCGGNRDRDKRPKMTAAVQELADHAWATADNPRREKISSIFDDMHQGVTKPDAIEFIDDRRRAISLALDAAAAGDCVLIAGKGHETYQEFADTVAPFDDRQVARELLNLKKLRPH
ncbi:UDP-N-acetylmuramoyl-L-alanyl-D-glutamate--2,6-diaminopimelate ligase [Cerasicoccus fimbriatus]|uniref:UDP-N-acetylmuramoyl-L-alanyl-D-glutamate--2, 6-diaminopimelate ligase n=1 Tax=Cerasicoccus fimbriatus TaxID=3014554 RepID=UPI0022B48BC8|nr:UDP-N-acetylmuramoyl-L-alanyl-D-glutamate--2,6-diaminopimelate ligase [Cerasicoccus sp. TK19100]